MNKKNYMKKIFQFALALSCVFAAASCDKQMYEHEANCAVAYEISLPEEMLTKGSSGYDKYDLHYQVFKADQVNDPQKTPVIDSSKQMDGNSTTLSLELLNNQSYTILFWANKQGTSYYDTDDLRKVSHNSADGNNADSDAFCGVDPLLQLVNGSKRRSIELFRPLAEVNLATTVNDIVPVSTTVTFKGVPSSYNVYAGAASAQTADLTFTTPYSSAIYPENPQYRMLAKHYVFVSESISEVTYEILTSAGSVNGSVTGVSAKKNYRTNILGSFLPSFEHTKAELSQGLTKVQGYDGLYTNSNGDYCLVNLESLKQWYSFLKDSTGVNPFNCNVYLLNDIDADSWVWTNIPVYPASTASTGYIFNGLGCTIRNLKIEGSLHSLNVAGMTFKNLTLDGVTVEQIGNATAVFVSTSTGNVSFDNVKVKNATVAGGYNTAVFVGELYDAYGTEVLQASLKNCSVETSSISSSTTHSSYPTGASGFVGLVRGSNSIVFEGNNSIDDATTITNTNGLVGGRVYAFSTLNGADWTATGSSDSFTDRNNNNNSIN